MNKSNKPNWKNRRREFWQQLEKATYAKSELHSKFRARNDGHLQRLTGLEYVVYGFVVSEHQKFARVEVYIERKDPLQNDQIFDLLQNQQTQIETDVGEGLLWQRLNHRRVSRISFRYRDVDFSTIASRDQLVDTLSDMMVKFEKGFGDPLRKIEI